MIYLVAGPGRTGSIWLSEIIKYQLGTSQVYHLHTGLPLLTAMLNDSAAVVHTHDKFFIQNNGIPPESVTLILSRRRNSFEWILSHYIAQHTREYGNYSSKEVTPIELNLRLFKLKFLFRDYWYKGHATLPYASISTVYYEDMVSATSYVSLLQNVIPSPIEYPAVDFSYGKSPYNYKNIISNWEELHEWYQNQVT